MDLSGKCDPLVSEITQELTNDESGGVPPKVFLKLLIDLTGSWVEKALS